jgi:hypothetical protein
MCERFGDLTDNHERQAGMCRQRNFLLFIAFAMGTAAPALGQTATPVGESTSGATNSAASIPDFSRVWFHPSFPWFEPPASGPGPIKNLSRWPQLRSDAASGTLALPPGVEGVSDYDQLVRDYTNPILQPWAAEAAKKFGEMSLAGITYRDAAHSAARGGCPYAHCTKM